MEDILKVFNINSFLFTKETSKAIEFRHIHNKEVIYLLRNKEISIVLNPDTIKETLIDTSQKKYHSTALSKFPKELHTGKEPIHFGYLFKFENSEELNTFLRELN
ncbi:hypothetical protein [Litchfieldia alkalitelluris]|uniref:hypothetical protein n=1 Tax=Litchfieldia alkalitelluris TaxID=304268 RepID=UPI000997B694|nr:hypothetical protein [Litchfieldia alkalitelluris]